MISKKRYSYACQNGYAYTTEELASEVGNHVARTQYHLDRLMQDAMIEVPSYVDQGDPPRYEITAEGRSYVVVNDLLPDDF